VKERLLARRCVREFCGTRRCSVLLPGDNCNGRFTASHWKYSGDILAHRTHNAALGDGVLKVNHPGEHGAINIYWSQLLACWWRDAEVRSELREFLGHEKRQRAIFAAELARRGRRRCRSYMFCGVGGFALGLVTGLCGRAAIAATTVAVEAVVLRHLEAQIASSGFSRLGGGLGH
jgi:demethoxyubiquinone hydroxylase (CLK1/Coq7/Cat5 family)